MEIHSLRRTSQEEEEILPSAGTWRKESWQRLSLPYRALCAERKETDTSSLRYWHQSRIPLPLLAVPPVQKTRLRYRGGDTEKVERNFTPWSPLRFIVRVFSTDVPYLVGEGLFVAVEPTNGSAVTIRAKHSVPSLSLLLCLFIHNSVRGF